MEIIHRYRTAYPFGMPKESEVTFVQVIRQSSGEDGLRAILKALKEADSPHLMKVVRVLKEEGKLHALYEYHSLSYRSYLATAPPNLHALESALMEAVRSAAAALVKVHLKADLFLANLAVAPTLKFFVEADCEFLADEHLLRLFYHEEEDRLKIQLHQEFQNAFGPLQVEKPNFVIKGTKLFFDRKEESKGNKLFGKEEKGAILDKPDQDFKVEQFTTEQTYVLEEHDYLQSLQEELQNIGKQKNSFEKTPKGVQQISSHSSEKKLSPLQSKKEGKEESREETSREEKSKELSMESIKGKPLHTKEAINHSLEERKKSEEKLTNSKREEGRKVMVSELYPIEEHSKPERAHGKGQAHDQCMHYLEKVRLVKERAQQLLKVNAKRK